MKKDILFVDCLLTEQGHLKCPDTTTNTQPATDIVHFHSIQREKLTDDTHGNRSLIIFYGNKSGS